ncbi:MAG: class I SAM-dependent DNA methyltransferase [Ilumatobacteraceae bacterium]
MLDAGEAAHGEADFIDTLDVDLGASPGAVLDAGCGTGRLAIELARRGRDVVGIDLDPDMVERAQRKAPELEWHVADLATMALARTFPLIVMAGNIMLFCRPEDLVAIVVNLATHLEPGGRLVDGLSTDRQGYPLERYDELCAAAGLTLEARYATWERAPFAGGDGADSEYAVSVHLQR